MNHILGKVRNYFRPGAIVAKTNYTWQISVKTTCMKFNIKLLKTFGD